MAHTVNNPQEDLALPEYYPLNFELWTLFEDVDPEERTKIELVHIFGEATELLSAYFVTCDDAVYGVGRNDFGRLGIGELLPDVIDRPREIEHLTGKRVTSFACGAMHTLALTEAGEVFPWGFNMLGPLGHGTIINRDSPGLVLLPQGVKIKAIGFACGAMHTLALTEAGEVFSWGFNMLGPLGHGTIINRDSPGLVLLPQGVKIKAIGAKCSYSVAITTDNVVLHWGDIMSTECSCQNMPIELEFPEPISFRQLACATSHVCLLTSDSKVYLWGTSPGEEHLDGLHPVPPQLITTKEHKNITSIACSREVTVALNENGRIYVLLSPTSLDIIVEAQKTLPVMEIAGSPFSDTPIVFRMGDEGFIRIFPPYDPTDSDSYYCSDSMKNIQCAFHGMATPQVCRRKIDELDSRVHKIQGPERNIGITLYNVKDHSDLTVQLSDGEVYVHKLILVSFCEHFKSMLLGPWAEHNTNDAKVLDMKRYNPRAFRAFLKYVYNGGLDLMQGEDLIDLYDISKSYLEDELVSMCSKMFVKIIKPNSVASLYKKAADNECEELMRHLVTFTSGCLEQVIISEGFENLDSQLAKSKEKEVHFGHPNNLDKTVFVKPAVFIGPPHGALQGNENDRTLPNFLQSRWAVGNGLLLNPSKSQVILLYKNNIPTDPLPPVLVDGVVVPYSQHVRNLGLYIDKAMSWEHQIAQMFPHNVIEIMEQRKIGVVSGSCYKKSVLRSLGASLKVNKVAFCSHIRGPLNGDVDGNKLLIVKKGNSVVTYLVEHSDGGNVSRMAGIWRSSCAANCAGALCARWCCQTEHRLTVSGKTGRLHLVDATNMKEVTCFNMSYNGVKRTHSHAHSPKLANSVAVISSSSANSHQVETKFQTVKMMVLAAEAHCTVRKYVAASQLAVWSHQQKATASKAIKGVIATVGTNLEKLLLLDLRSGEMIMSPGRLGSIRGLTWCPAQDYLLVTATAHSLQLWDVRRLAAPLGDFDSCPMSDQILPQIAFWGSTRVLTMVSRNFISVHDLQTRKMLRIMSELHLDGYRYQGGAFRFAVNNGADLLYCPFDNSVSVVDLNSGNLIWALSEHRHSVKSIFFNPQLNSIYSFSFNESYIWSPSS